MLSRRLGLIACCATLLAPASAAAQQDDVVVDPESPTGKEYVIPLEGARRDADPSRGGTAHGASDATRSAPLFGEGIVAATSRGRAPGARGQGGSTQGSSETEGGALPPRGGAGRGSATLTVGAPDGGTSTAVLFGGAGALVLLVGVLAGIALRRRTGG